MGWLRTMILADEDMSVEEDFFLVGAVEDGRHVVVVASPERATRLQNILEKLPERHRASRTVVTNTRDLVAHLPPPGDATSPVLIVCSSDLFSTADPRDPLLAELLALRVRRRSTDLLVLVPATDRAGIIDKKVLRAASVCLVPTGHTPSVGEIGPRTKVRVYPELDLDCTLTTT